MKLPPNGKALDLTPAKKDLVKLSKALDDPENLSGDEQEYYGTIIEGGNKIAKRKRRMEILRDILKKHV